MIYKNIIIGFWLLFMVVWLISSFTAKKSVSGINRKFVIFRFGISIVLFLILATGRGQNLLQYNFGFNNTIQLIGTIFVGVGILLAVWARFNIGRNWGMPMSLRESPELVTSGPYKYIRHPIYTGAILALFGTALALGIFWFILFIFFGVYFIYSATTEEKMLSTRIPGYTEYMKHSKMLIPFIY